MVTTAYTVATYLQNAGFGTLGTDIFVNESPEETNCIFVMNSGGQSHNYTPIEEAVVDIYCKNIKSELAISKLEDIKREIHRVNNITIGDDYIFTFLTIGDVDMVVDRDDDGAKIYKITIQVVHRDNNLIS